MIICYLACFGFGIALLESIRLYCGMKRCNCSTWGTIINVKKSLGFSKNETYLSYQPVYQYTISGKAYIGKVNMMSADPERYKLESEVLLYYEESNPRNFMPNDEIKYVKKSLIENALLFVIFLTIVVLGVLEKAKK